MEYRFKGRVVSRATLWLLCP